MYDGGMGAADLLGELGLPEDLIADVRSMLAGSAEDLETGNVKPISPGLFGGSDAGAQLGHHSSVAQQHVAKAVLQRAAGRRGYRDTLAGFVDDLGDTDAANPSALNGLATSTSCVAGESFESNSSCKLPASTAEGR